MKNKTPFLNLKNRLVFVVK